MFRLNSGKDSASEERSPAEGSPGPDSPEGAEQSPPLKRRRSGKPIRKGYVAKPGRAKRRRGAGW
jgi:hypothetical protein